MPNRIVNPAQLRALAQELRAGGHGELAKELRKAIRQAARPALADVRTAVLELDVYSSEGSRGVDRARGGGRRARAEHAASRVRTERGQARARRRAGLRQSIAAATSVKARERGVRFEVDSSRLPEDQRRLPRLLESPRGWRHPVFGNTEVWVDERGGPWFYPTLISHQPRFHAALAAAMDDAGRKLAQKIGAI